MLMSVEPSILTAHQPDAAPARLHSWQPTTHELECLGPVACIWNEADRSELLCLKQARIAQAYAEVGPYGVEEWITFTRGDGQCTLRLHALADHTHMPAWQQLVTTLPSKCALPGLTGGCERMMAKCWSWVRGHRFRLSILQFMPGASMASGPAATLHSATLLSPGTLQRLRDRYAIQHPLP